MEFTKISKENVADFNPAIKNGAMVLFFSNGCGHCTTMKPQWDALQEKLRDLERELHIEENNVTKCPNIVSVDVEAAPELDSKWHRHTASIPTILAIRENGDNIEFNDERTTENFIKFMKKHLSHHRHKSHHRHNPHHRHSKKNKKKRGEQSDEYESIIIGGSKKKKFGKKTRSKTKKTRSKTKKTRSKTKKTRSKTKKNYSKAKKRYRMKK